MTTPEELIADANGLIGLDARTTNFINSAVAHAKELIALRVLAGRMVLLLSLISMTHNEGCPCKVCDLIADCRAVGLLPPKPSAEAGEGEKT